MHVRKSDNLKAYYRPVPLLWITAIATLRLTWEALRTPSDVIQVCKPQPMNGLAAWINHKVRRVPVYLDSDDYEAVNNRFGGRWQQRIVAWFEDWIPTFADAVIVGTTFIGERYKSLGFPSEQIIFVPNGAERERFSVLDRPGSTERIRGIRKELQITSEDRVVVYVGSMSLVSHAIDLLLEAFSLIIQQQPNALLIMVGAGEDLGNMQQLAQHLRISDRVRFTGYVPGDEVPLYYRLGEVTVDPMRTSVAAESSLSLKLIESIAAGVPCVTADIGDRQDFVGNAGVAVTPGDHEALSAGILSMLKDIEKAKRMRVAAQDARGMNWWDRRVEALVTLYPPGNACDG
jgi:glycosyltransferase involved in cell wall biosynthesis